MSILIGADFVPTDSNCHYFCNSNLTALLGSELSQLLYNADYRIFNLEIPLTDKNEPIKKCGPNLIAPTKAVNGYAQMRVDLLTLANNHILDQGIGGLRSTLEQLRKHNIHYVGAGENIQDAIKPFIFDWNKKRIGVYACAEHEFSGASASCGGANLFDPLYSLDHVSQLKNMCDFVIVLYHGGKEHYRYPSPNLQKVCRRLIEKGANLVICQHSHCIGCEEKYLDGTIVYGQGNFLFDRSQSNYWKTSLLICLESSFKIKYIPLVKKDSGVRIAKGEKADEILQEFYSRSKKIGNDAYVEKQYEEFASKSINDYLSVMAGKDKKSLLFRLLNKITKHQWQRLLWKIVYQKANRLTIQNFIECEAHRELFLTGLKNSMKD